MNAQFALIKWNDVCTKAQDVASMDGVAWWCVGPHGNGAASAMWDFLSLVGHVFWLSKFYIEPSNL